MLMVCSLLLVGRVSAVAKLHVTVELPFKLDKLAKQLWRLEKLGNIVTYERNMAALMRVAQTDKLAPSKHPCVGACLQYSSLYN